MPWLSKLTDDEIETLSLPQIRDLARSYQEVFSHYTDTMKSPRIHREITAIFHDQVIAVDFYVSLHHARKALRTMKFDYKAKADDLFHDGFREVTEAAWEAVDITKRRDSFELRKTQEGTQAERAAAMGVGTAIDGDTGSGEQDGAEHHGHNEEKTGEEKPKGPGEHAEAERERVIGRKKD